jgi:hypothetical protein
VAVVILALAVVGGVVGGATVLGAPVLAVPIVLLLLAGWGAVAFVRRALGREPREREPIRFGAEDRATLYPSPSPAERSRNRERAARRVAND